MCIQDKESKKKVIVAETFMAYTAIEIHIDHSWEGWGGGSEGCSTPPTGKNKNALYNAC